jgi:hypothetical protein
MAEVDLEFALSHLRGRCEDGSLVRARFGFRAFMIVLTVRIRKVEGADITLAVDDGGVNEAVVRLRPEYDFLFEDMRDFPDLINKFVDGLTIVFNPDAGTDEHDTLTLAELKEPMDS